MSCHNIGHGLNEVVRKVLHAEFLVSSNLGLGLCPLLGKSV